MRTYIIVHLLFCCHTNPLQNLQSLTNRKKQITRSSPKGHLSAPSQRYSPSEQVLSGTNLCERKLAGFAQPESSGKMHQVQNPKDETSKSMKIFQHSMKEMQQCCILHNAVLILYCIMAAWLTKEKHFAFSFTENLKTNKQGTEPKRREILKA